MNALSHRLELRCPVKDIDDVLQCLTHSILFQRLIARSEPELIDSQALSISYPRISDPEVVETVTTRVREYASRVERSLYTATPGNPPEYPPYTVRLFATSPGALIPKKTLFEMWTIALSPVAMNLKDVDAANAISVQLTADLQSCLMTVVTSTCEAVRRDHLPPLTPSGRGYGCNVRFEVGSAPSETIIGRLWRHWSGERPGV